MISGIIINYIKRIAIWIIYMDEKVIKTSLHNRILNVIGAMISLLGSM
jgi:hypothetical protein